MEEFFENIFPKKILRLQFDHFAAQDIATKLKKNILAAKVVPSQLNQYPLFSRDPCLLMQVPAPVGPVVCVHNPTSTLDNHHSTVITILSISWTVPQTVIPLHKSSSPTCPNHNPTSHEPASSLLMLVLSVDQLTGAGTTVTMANAGSNTPHQLVATATALFGEAGIRGSIPGVPHWVELGGSVTSFQSFPLLCPHQILCKHRR